MKSRRHVSSGGVIFKVTETGAYAALISHYSRRGRTVWCLPKGTIEEGESLQQTALREVREETGLVGCILEKVGAVQFCFYSKEEDTRIFKTVHFYLMDYRRGNECDHDDEATEARWVQFGEAMKMLTHASERDILEKAAYCLEQRFSLKCV